MNYEINLVETKDSDTMVTRTRHDVGYLARKWMIDNYGTASDSLHKEEWHTKYGCLVSFCEMLFDPNEQV